MSRTKLMKPRPLSILEAAEILGVAKIPGAHTEIEFEKTVTREELLFEAQDLLNKCAPKGMTLAQAHAAVVREELFPGSIFATRICSIVFLLGGPEKL